MATFDELLERLSNWGKWGADDERGALNYITDEKRRDAAGLVKRGRTFSLSSPTTGGTGPQTGLGGRINPIHHMTATGCDPESPFPIGGGAGFAPGTSSKSGRRSSKRAIALRTSIRARLAPRQKWVPKPKDMWRIGSRATSKESGSGWTAIWRTQRSLA